MYSIYTAPRLTFEAPLIDESFFIAPIEMTFLMVVHTIKKSSQKNGKKVFINQSKAKIYLYF